MKKVELNKDNRIKRSENYNLLNSIKANISARIHTEFNNEITALRNENDVFLKEEKEFYAQVLDILKNVQPDTLLKIVSQTGIKSNRLTEYTGYLIKTYGTNATVFDFVSNDRDNDMRPFTVGFSCLQSIEILNS